MECETITGILPISDKNLHMAKDNKPEQVEGKGFAIVVNGRPFHEKRDRLSFDDCLALAYDGNPQRAEHIIYTITYRKGGGRPDEGELGEGEFLKVQNGTIIKITKTDQS